MRIPALNKNKIARPVFVFSLVLAVLATVLIIRFLDDSDQRLLAEIPTTIQNPPSEPVELEIPSGLNVGEIAQLLSDSRIGGHQRDLLTLVGLLDSGRSIR